MRQPVAVIGLGCRFPGARDARAYWEMLCSGGSGIGAFRAGWDDAEVADRLGSSAPRVDIGRGGFLPDPDRFDPIAFGVSRREALELDPQQRLLLEVAMETMEDAGISCDRPSATGVFIGISGNDYSFLKIKGPGGLASINVFTGIGNTHSIAANRLSYVFDMSGPSIAIDTACSSSMVAVHLAMRSLNDGDCEMALAGGVNFIMSPEVSIGFARSNMLSPTGQCWTFDARADGYVRGEGCGLVLLKPLDAAERDGDRILALLHGSAVNQDGFTRGMTRPNQDAQVRVIRAALAAGGVEPGSIGYVEAHGTGTPLGDPVETEALKQVFGGADGRGAPLPIGSVKANIGHLETAAGIAGLIKAVLALRAGRIPPQRNFETPNPRCALDDGMLDVPREARDWPSGEAPRMAGVSGYGFGGTNSHVVVGEAPADLRPTAADGPWRIVTLATRNRVALPATAAALAEGIARDGVALADIALTSTEGRAHRAHRRAFVAADVAALQAALAETGRADPPVSGQRPPHIAFLFAADAALPAMAARALHDEEPAFRDALDDCDARHRDVTGAPLLEAIFSGAKPTPAALLALQLAVAALWRSWNIHPQAQFGDGAGRIAAACDAGLVSRADAMCRILSAGDRAEDVPAGPIAGLDAAEVEMRAEAGCDVFVLIGGCEPFAAAGSHLFVPPLDCGGNGLRAMLKGLAALYERGAEVDWAAVNRGRGRKVGLPTTAFVRESYWFDRDEERSVSGPPRLIR